MASTPHTNDIPSEPKEKEEGGPLGKLSPRHFLYGGGVFFLELLKVVILAGITIGAVRYFIFKPFIVHGASMSPNFYEKEYLIIDEISYRFNEPVRGNVIVLKNPSNDGEFFLKRVIGLPGERIVVRDGKVFIATKENSTQVELREAYLPEREYTPGAIDVTLGAGEYYVLGDNRDASFDSRMFGPIIRDAMIGKVLLRGWPFDRAQRFSVPEYNI